MNCDPLSDDMSIGTPKRAIKCVTSACAQVWVDVSKSAIASGHSVNLSMVVKRWGESMRGWQRSNQIHMDVVKTVLGNFKCRKRCSNMVVDL